MNPFDHSEDAIENAVKKLLEETAEQIKPSPAFTANLEKQLKQTHKPKAGFNMSTVKKIAAPIGWGLALIALAFAFNWIASQIAPKNIPASSNPDFICPITAPNGSMPPGEALEDANYLGNDQLWTRLWPDGKIYMTANDQIPDGSFSIKWPWWQAGDGTLTIEGHRLDSESETLRVQITEGYPGYQVSALTFPTSGCWEVTGYVGDSSLTFVAEVVTPQPTPFSEESTPVTTISTPTGQVYQWNEQPIYLNASLPEAPAVMKVYLQQDEVIASVEDVQTLAQKFGMNGEIYEVSGEIPGTTNYLMVDGNQQLRVRSDRYFTYYPNYAEAMYAFNTQEPPELQTLIDEFMQTHNLGDEYKIEHSELQGGYLVLPLTPDGFTVRHEHFLSNGYLFDFNGNGILRVSSSMLQYNEVATTSVISAEEALNKLLDPAGIYGSVFGMHPAITRASSWTRNWPLDQTFTYYGFLTSTARSITGATPYIRLDGYTVTGNVGNIPENMPNTFVEATGQFHQTGVARTFELDSWKLHDGYEEGHEGAIQQQDNQIVFITLEGNKLNISNLPDNLPLPLENVFISGVTHDNEFVWKHIGIRNMGSGGGGGGGTGFYQLNLSGTPVPLPTNIPLPETPMAVDAPRFEGQRGMLTVTIYNQADGSQRMEYHLVSSDSNYPYVRLEGANLDRLQAYHNQPVEIWGAAEHFWGGDNVDEQGILVLQVERFEVPFPDLQFQVLKGTEKSTEIEGNTALLFTAEDGQTYVELGPNCYDIIGPESVEGTGEAGETRLIEGLLVPDLTLGGYSTVCVFSTAMATNPKDGQPMELTITADQPYIADTSIPSPRNPPTMSIEKVELAYFTPDRRYYPASEQPDEPPYLQPVWIFSGHYSDGSEFEFIVQALKDEFLSPQVQPARQPG